MTLSGGLTSRSSCIIEPTCADARWAHRSRFPSVWPSPNVGCKSRNLGSGGVWTDSRGAKVTCGVQCVNWYAQVAISGSHPTVWFGFWRAIQQYFFVQPYTLQLRIRTSSYCSYVCLSICPSICLWLDKNYWTIIHISGTVWVRVPKIVWWEHW